MKQWDPFKVYTVVLGIMFSANVFFLRQMTVKFERVYEYMIEHPGEVESIKKGYHVGDMELWTEVNKINAELKEQNPKYYYTPRRIWF